jgi:hypothetical protein
MSKSDPCCPKCGGALERGSLGIGKVPPGMDDAILQSSIPGIKTSWNPVKAFAQGLSDEPGDRIYPLAELSCVRCQGCAYLELYAVADQQRTTDQIQSNG